MFISRRSILSLLAALPPLMSGCGAAEQAPATTTAPSSAADQERLQREAMKNLGLPGKGVQATSPPKQ